MIILGIETSCDETAAAVIDGSHGEIRVLSGVVSSQIEIHKKYGGVVPEVAAREHVLNIIPVINEALGKAGIERPAPPLARGRWPKAGRVGALAVTAGPGLITSLMTGVETAKTLACAWKLPVVAINHIEGHIYANFIGETSRVFKVPSRGPRILRGDMQSGRGGSGFPALILTVSGGHTMLVLMRGHGQYETVGETLDDAAGEAFDKAAQLMGLGYPGGPAVAAAAARITNYELRITDKPEITLPRPMMNKNNFDFSFSGLKTALLYTLKKNKNWKKRVPEYAAEFQQAVIDCLIRKTVKAAQKYGVKNIMLSGGVAANRELRRQMEEAVKNDLPDARFFVPELEYTTDNAVMIAVAGYFHAARKDYTPWQKLKADCNLVL